MAIFSQKAKLLRGLLTGETAYAGPFFVLVDITRRCNLSCLGCRFHSKQMSLPPPDEPVPDISFRLFEKLCRDLRAMGTQSLILTGDGEPLLHDRIFDMISEAKNAGFHVTLVTNGTLIHRDIIQSFFESRLDALQVSLWASSDEEYKKNYPGAPAENFKRVVDSVTLLNSLKTKNSSGLPYVFLHQPLNRHNYRGMDAFLELALATRSDAVSFAPFYTWRGALDSFALSPDEEKSLLLSLAQMEKRARSLRLGHNIGQTRLRYQIGKQMWQSIPCYIGWIHARIKTDGTILPCNRCDIPMGNIDSDSFREIWNDFPYRNFRRRTLTREGLASLNRHCDCEYCCFLKDSLRIHRFFKWISPLLHPAKEGDPRDEN